MIGQVATGYEPPSAQHYQISDTEAEVIEKPKWADRIGDDDWWRSLDTFNTRPPPSPYRQPGPWSDGFVFEDQAGDFEQKRMADKVPEDRGVVDAQLNETEGTAVAIVILEKLLQERDFPAIDALLPQLPSSLRAALQPPS